MEIFLRESYELDVTLMLCPKKALMRESFIKLAKIGKNMIRSVKCVKFNLERFI